MDRSLLATLSSTNSGPDATGAVCERTPPTCSFAPLKEATTEREVIPDLGHMAQETLDN